MFSRLSVSSLLLAALAVAPASARLVDGIVEFTGDSITNLPKKMSQTGLYKDLAKKVIADGIVPFTVNVPLWSDGAHKERWIQVPVGAKVVPTDTDLYDFPNKTVFVKNFSIDTVYGDSATRILIETRFLVVRKSDFPGESNPVVQGLSYKWRRDQSDADLVDFYNPLDTLIKVKTKGGRILGKRWTYPTGHCTECHINRGVLGFMSPQLNDGKQLKHLVDVGVLSTDPFKGAANTFRWYAHDSKAAAATPEVKARSYLAANCSNCHGGGNTFEACVHNFDFMKSPAPNINSPAEGAYVGKRRLTSLDDTLLYPFIVDAGRPENSFAMRRLTTRATIAEEGGLFTRIDNDTAMPPLGTYQIDSTNVNMVRDWICSLKPGASCKLPPIAPDTSFWDMSGVVGVAPHVSAARGGGAVKAFFHGRTLVVEGKGPLAGAALYDWRGRRVPLVRSGEREFRLAQPMPAGTYFLKAGGSLAKVDYLP